MSNWLFKVASLICIITFLAHEILGAPMVLPPLSEAGLNDEVIWLHHFSWHVGSVCTVAMAGMFFYTSIRPGNLALAVVATLMSIGFTAVGIGLAIIASDTMWGTPAPYIWSVVTIVASFGVYCAPERRNT